jgi:hypothetical protein
MDITVCVMLPARGGDPTIPANPKYRLLSPVAVTPMGDTTQPIGAQCTGYIHVTGVPMRAGWAALTNEAIMQRINAKLCKVWENADRTVREHRALQGIAASIPAGARNTLLTERQLTVTWTQFKNFIQNLIESRTLVDTDLD